MPDIEGGLSGLLSVPLVLPASVAGAVAALFVVVGVIAWRRARSRLLLAFAGVVLVVLAVLALVEQLSLGERASMRRALLAREAELTKTTLVPGSPLACLDAGAGEAVENACEKVVFASAQNIAAAVAYMGARLSLLAVAANDDGDAQIRAALASTRRAVELDRFGLAAHVLAIRDGCTADACAAFALVDNASVLKANLKAQVFDQYVSRYAAGWNAPASASEKKPPAVSAVPSEAPVAQARPTAVGAAPVAAIKPGEHWDYPSADSIPAVSIMNAEPPTPKEADAAAKPSAGKSPENKSDRTVQKEAASTAKPTADAAPLPPKRPRQQAPPPAAR
jgi:hypothetical protein